MFGSPASTQAGANPSGTGSGGFSFGGGLGTQGKPTGFALPNTAAPAGVGFNLGAATSKPGTLTLGTPATQASTGGLAGLLNTSTTSSQSVGFTPGGANPLGLGGAAPASTATGLSLGGAASKTAGFALGGAAPASITAGFAPGGAAPASKTAGFALGGTAPASKAAGFALGGAAPATLGGTASTAASTGLTLGGATPAGFSLGGTSQPGSLGVFGGAATSSALGGTSTGIGFSGGLGGAKPSLSLGGTTGQPASTATGIFSNSSLTTTSTTQQTNRGLGGQDPKTSTSGASTSGSGGKAGDSKVVKECQVPPEIVATVDSFEKYVREQKNIREHIARMSSKPLYKVQEDIASLRQLISSVKNGLQRNAVCIEKLKHESSQELKHAEIAQRTKDTPAGLQYENTAPTEYFSGLVDEFERQMMAYRQQIEEMENHLTSLSHQALLTPQELSMLLRKLYESFVALAAQLQTVHEAVKIQKEHYMNYRRVFHNDTTDIFEKRKRVQDATGCAIIPTMPGPTPFTGVTSQVASAKATALNRPQQPAGLTGGSTFGGIGSTPAQGSLYGASNANTSLGFGSTGFKSTSFGAPLTAPITGTVPPLGGGSLFGSATTTTAGSLGFGAGNASFGVTGSFAQQSPFQLGKPPAGNKRTKKT